MRGMLRGMLRGAFGPSCVVHPVRLSCSTRCPLSPLLVLRRCVVH
jgi:hypothetical protein